MNVSQHCNLAEKKVILVCIRQNIVSRSREVILTLCLLVRPLLECCNLFQALQYEAKQGATKMTSINLGSWTRWLPEILPTPTDL